MDRVRNTINARNIKLVYKAEFDESFKSIHIFMTWVQGQGQWMALHITLSDFFWRGSVYQRNTLCIYNRHGGMAVTRVT